MIDESTLPSDRAGRERWLSDRQDEIARLTRRALRRIIGDAADAYSTSLTAAGDLAAFDGIPRAWLAVIESEIAPAIAETYQAGQVTAWLGLRSTPSERYAARWAAVANENAVSYLRDATNRLSGVGDRTWRQVRAKAQSAVAKGLPNEALKAEIEKLTGFSEFRADTIARTETVAAYVQGDLAGARALGDNGPVEKVWVATFDARTRPSHEEAHDQCVPIDEKFSVGGELMDAPHDPDADAGEVVNCRCYVEFLYPGDTRPDGSVIEGEPDDETTDVGAPIEFDSDSEPAVWSP